MLTGDERDQLAEELLDFIAERAADLVAADPWTFPRTPAGYAYAALVVEHGMRQVAEAVSARLDSAARRAGLTYDRIGQAQGRSRQAAHSAVVRRAGAPRRDPRAA